MNLMELVRRKIRAMEGYVPGWQPPGPGWVKLNTNENPYPPSPRVLEVLRAQLGDSLRLYPDPLATELRRAVSEVYGVEVDWVIAGNGSDELLALIMRTFVEPGDQILIPYPTYSLYETLADIQDARLKKVPFPDDYSLPDLTGPAKLVFICNPNSPSGTFVAPEVIERLASRTRALVVVDEAYVLFAEANCLPLLGRCPNVVILRTLSKSHSLAGMRIGFAVARPEIVRELNKVKDSYNLDRLAIAAGAAAIRDVEYTRTVVEKVKSERGRLAEELRSLGFFVYPSQSNFLLVRALEPPARHVFEELSKRKILVRYFDRPRTDDCLRVTVGDPCSNSALLSAIMEIGKSWQERRL